MGLKQYQTKQRVLGTRIEKEIEIEKAKKSLQYWEQIASATPTYRDAYIQLAVISYQLASYDEAKKYLQKTMEIDPNWQVPPQLAPLLQ